MHITPDTHVSDIAAASPATIKVFQQYGIDFCCGGHRPISEACLEHQIDPDVLLADLASALAAPATERVWQDAPLTDLITEIQTRFHQPLREELPRLTAMLDKVISRHGNRHGDMLHALRGTFAPLRDEILEHMQKEDLVLFPAIRARHRDVATPIEVMEQDHAAAGAALAELRRITDDYQPPAGACPTFQGLFYGMAQLERDMHLHIHLENNILFPRAGAGDY